MSSRNKPITRFIKKPSIPALTGWPDFLLPVLKPIRETIEIITGRRGQKLSQLSGEVSADLIAERVNEIIRVLQDGLDTEVQVAGTGGGGTTITVSVELFTRTRDGTVRQSGIDTPMDWVLRPDNTWGPNPCCGGTTDIWDPLEWRTYTLYAAVAGPPTIAATYVFNWDVSAEMYDVIVTGTR